MNNNGYEHDALPVAARILLLMGLVLASTVRQAQAFTDSAGRIVAIPDTINRVYAAGPPAMVLVYLSPTASFRWIDRPPSINRLIGLKWLSTVFFPERTDLDLEAITREFYELFYHVDLSEQKLDTLIQWANGRTPQ